jgi:hypothetical protein
MAETIKDGARVLDVRPLTPRLKMKLLRSFGAASDVQTWVGQAMLACMVTAIDGIPVPVPANADQADALVEQVEGPNETGLAAVAGWYGEFAKSRTFDKEAAKN